MVNDGCMRLRENEESENRTLRCDSRNENAPFNVRVTNNVQEKKINEIDFCGMVSFVAEVCDAHCIFACNTIDSNDFQINMSIWNWQSRDDSLQKPSIWMRAPTKTQTHTHKHTSHSI